MSDLSPSGTSLPRPQPDPFETLFEVANRVYDAIVAQAAGSSDSNLRCSDCQNFRHAVPAHKPDCPKAWKNCPGCTGTDSAGAHIASCPLSAESVVSVLNKQNEPETVLRTTPFEIERAIAGAPFIHRFDMVRPAAIRYVMREILRFAHAEHPAIFVWRKSEWQAYPDNSEGHEELMNDWRIVENLPPYRVKMAQCRHCSQPIVQWEARPSASYTHSDRHFYCGVGLYPSLAEPVPGSIFDPNVMGVRG